MTQEAVKPEINNETCEQLKSNLVAELIRMSKVISDDSDRLAISTEVSDLLDAHLEEAYSIGITEGMSIKD